MKLHSFTEVVTDVTSKFKKIKASDYQSQGKYKIIDQGKEPIAGYTDDASLVNGQLLPVLIFGDHTRALKYEDEPIALGADGAKALWVNPDLAIARYVYYYLRSIEIKDAGYSRHFKFLKEIEVPIPFKNNVPDFDDQIRIAHLLGKVEGLIAQRKHNMQQLDDLLTGVFLDMFGDPVRNEKGWEVKPCDNAVLDISSGTSYGGEDRAFVSPDEVGVLKISAVTKGTFDPTEFKVVNPAQITKALRFVKRGDFLFSRANTVELVAACCIVPQDYPQLFLPDKLWVLTLNSKLINPQFFNYLIKNKRYRDVIRNLASGGHDSMLNISMKKFMTLGIPCPAMDLQNQFAAIVQKVDAIKSHYQKSLGDLETLYGALSQNAFKGELDLSRVSLPDIEHEEEKVMVTEAVHSSAEESLVLNLPDADDLLDALENSDARKELIAQWLEAYRSQLGTTPFSVQRFMAAAQTRLTDKLQALLEDKALDDEHKSRLSDLYPNNDIELDAKDYETIKDWVFKAIASKTLIQAHDQAGNRVQLNAVQP